MDQTKGTNELVNWTTGELNKANKRTN